MNQIPRAVAIALSTIGLLILGLALYALQQAGQTPDAAPTAITEAAATMQPTVVPRATVTIPTSATRFDSSRTNYSMLIPAGWVTVDAAEYGNLLANTEYNSAVTIGSADLADAFDLLAYDALRAQQGEFPATLTMLVAERHGLGLTGYLEATNAELAQVVEAEMYIDHTLRADGLPTGVLRFTTPDQQIMTTQAVLIDSSGTHFVIVTFATALDQSIQAQATWQAILHSIVFN